MVAVVQGAKVCWNVESALSGKESLQTPPAAVVPSPAKPNTG